MLIVNITYRPATLGQAFKPQNFRQECHARLHDMLESLDPKSAPNSALSFRLNEANWNDQLVGDIEAECMTDLLPICCAPATLATLIHRCITEAIDAVRPGEVRNVHVIMAKTITAHITTTNAALPQPA